MLLAWRGGVIALWAAFLFLISGLAHAEAYPSKLVRFIYPGPPGSVGDMLTRSIGEELAKSWGQAVIVDNRTGAGGIIGSSTAAKAAPDGYTIINGTRRLPRDQRRLAAEDALSPVARFCASDLSSNRAKRGPRPPIATSNLGESADCFRQGEAERD